jgi:hypothetical protein
VKIRIGFNNGLGIDGKLILIPIIEKLVQKFKKYFQQYSGVDKRISTTIKVKLSLCLLKGHAKKT